MMSIVESIPENLTYPLCSVSHGSTYDGWKSLLTSATKTVDIASYYWTLLGHGNVTDPTDKQGADIFNSLSELDSRGIRLRIVQSPPNSEYPNLDSKALQDRGVATVQDLAVTKLLGNGILHSKLWVIDSKHFYVGSANMDWRSLTQVKELGLLGLNCEALAEDFQRLFDIYWYLSTPNTPLPSPGMWPEEFTALSNMTHPVLLSINNSQPSSAFLASSPPPFCATGRTNDIDALLQVISSAKKFVYVAVMDYIPAVVYVPEKYYWWRIDVALREAAYRGIEVRLMGSYWNHTSQDMLRFMKSLSDNSQTGYGGTIETRLFVVPQLTSKNVPFTRVNHNKYMVADNAAYIGTSNWSGDYFISTGGISCIVQSVEPATTALQEQLKDVFERDWFSHYAHSYEEVVKKT